MVSIIILTYNSEQYIEKLVESVYKFNSGEEFEIIVADNKSSDKTVEKIKKFHARVKFVDNKKNVGFGAGINLAAKHAKGEHLLFVNPDTEWTNGSVRDLLNVFVRNEKIGIVGGKLVEAGGKSEKNAGKFLGFWGSAALALSLDETFGIRLSPSKIQKVDFVSGGFMMVSADVFRKLNGFDEHLFMYVEDMELCFRARVAGILTYFTPDAALIHMGQGSSDRNFAVKNIFRGILYFQKKHGNTFSYHLTKSLFKSKVELLVIVGRLMNNRYLTETYKDVLSSPT